MAFDKNDMGMVSNGSYLGGGFQVATRAEVTVGLLNTIVLKNSDSFKIVQKLINIKRVRRLLQTRTISITVNLRP